MTNSFLIRASPCCLFLQLLSFLWDSLIFEKIKSLQEEVFWGLLLFTYSRLVNLPRLLHREWVWSSPAWNKLHLSFFQWPWRWQIESKAHISCIVIHCCYTLLAYRVWRKQRETRGSPRLSSTKTLIAAGELHLMLCLEERVKLWHDCGLPVTAREKWQSKGCSAK